VRTLPAVNEGLQDLARQRAGVTSTGIGAAFEQEVTPPDLDGVRCRFFVSDGASVTAVDAEIARGDAILESEISVLAWQRALERHAGRFPADTRLLALSGAGQIELRGDDFRDADFDPADSGLAP
jgi:hypothetical protein